MFSESCIILGILIDDRSPWLVCRFDVDDRSVVSHLFHQWAKRQAFKDPKRLLGKVNISYFDSDSVPSTNHYVLQF